MATTSKPTYKFSMKLPECIERLSILEHEIADLNSQLKPLENEHSVLEQHILGLLANAGTDKFATKTFEVERKERDVVSAEDWNAFFKYLLKTKDSALIQQRLGTTHVKALLDSGKAVPGVKRLAVPYLATKTRK